MSKNEIWSAYAKHTESLNISDLKTNLEQLDENKLNVMIVDALSEAIMLQRDLHDWFEVNEQNLNFYKATLWHLSDALYTLPESLISDGRFPPHLEKDNKSLRLIDYYRFLAAFIKLAPTELLEIVTIKYPVFLETLKK